MISRTEGDAPVSITTGEERRGLLAWRTAPSDVEGILFFTEGGVKDEPTSIPLICTGAMMIRVVTLLVRSELMLESYL